MPESTDDVVRHRQRHEELEQARQERALLQRVDVVLELLVCADHRHRHDGGACRDTNTTTRRDVRGRAHVDATQHSLNGTRYDTC
jgi:hypothetical protein